MSESVIGAFLTSIAYALVLRVPKDKVIVASVNGALSWLIFKLLHPHCGLLFATYLAGICMACGAQRLARIYKTPVIVILIPSFIPFVPGGDIYKCTYYLLHDDAALSIHHLGYTVAISGMIALASISVEVCLQLAGRVKLLGRKEERTYSMEKVLLLTHGGWGVSLKNSVEMIIGKVDFVEEVALYPEEVLSEFKERVQQFVFEKEQQANDSHQVLHVTILTDLFGGTPTNVAAVIANEANTRIDVVTGLNSAVLLEACSQILNMNELNVHTLVENSQNSIFDVMEKIYRKGE